MLPVTNKQNSIKAMMKISSYEAASRHISLFFNMIPKITSAHKTARITTFPINSPENSTCKIFSNLTGEIPKNFEIKNADIDEIRQGTSPA